jgi:competence protein ComEC
MKSKTLILCASLIFLVGFFVFQIFTFSDNKLHIIFCDVGQGDGILIRTPNGSDIMIDAGPNSSILKCLENHMPFWDRTIELAFATHPDADHIGGYMYVLDSYEIKSYNTSKIDKDTGVFKAINEKLKEKKVPVRYIFAGDKFKTADGINLETFWPTRDYTEKNRNSKDANSFSLVQILTYDKFKALFTGDIEKEILDHVFSDGLTVNIFKIPHHGSRTGADEKSFSLIRSSFVPISAGKNNSYGHPHKEVLDLLKKFGLEYENTANSGDIEIVTNGTSTRVVR